MENSFGLVIRLLPYEEFLVELSLEASNGDFAGSTDLYADIEQIQQMAERLAGFPRHQGDVREFEFGDSGPDRERADLRFYAVGVRGHAAVRVVLRRRGADADEAAIHIPIEPAAIDRFVEALRKMTPQLRADACLDAANDADRFPR